MHRRPVLELLDRYVDRYADEKPVVERVRALVEGHADCFERHCLPGHVTASVWLASPDRNHFLLTLHRKLGRWLQLGGHVDGDPDPARSALREAREESGMDAFRLAWRDGAPLLVDVDVHRIPVLGAEPVHEHHDLRFLLVAEPAQALVVSDESEALRWFPQASLEEVCREESLLRLGRKAAHWLSDRRLELREAHP